MPHVTTLQFLQALYGEPIAPGRLVLFSRCKRGGTRHCDWLHNHHHAARLAQRYRKSRDIYFVVALQHPDLALRIARKRMPRISQRSVRGSEASAALLPALWVNIDLAGPGRRRNLPASREEALALFAAVGLPPSILVDSGSDLQGYWRLDPPLRLENRADRVAAKELLGRLQGAVVQAAAERGWDLNAPANLVQPLRLPGTFNHKEGAMREVSVLHFPLPGGLGDVRYKPADFAALAEVPEAIRAAPLFRDPQLDDRPRADLLPVYRGCPWMRHLWLDRTEIGRREWQAGVNLYGRCALPGVGSRRIVHRISRDHPGYSAAQTDDQFDLAVQRQAAHTCRFIGKDLRQHTKYCTGCQHRGRIHSPIDLGRRGLQKTHAARTSHPAGCASPKAAGAPHPRLPPDPRRAILVTPREDEVNDQALEALAKSEPNLFRRGGLLVRIAGTEARDPAPHDQPARPVIQPLRSSHLREMLARRCRFEKRRGQPGSPLHTTHPPRWTVRALLARGAWPELPALHSLVETPALRPDGTLIEETGLDRATGTVYAPSGEFAPSTANDRDAAVAAVEQLRRVVADVPFHGEASFAAWLSTLLTPLARPAFHGPAPLHRITASKRGAGQRRLADSTSLLLTGRPAPRLPARLSAEELRRQITGFALEAAQLVLIEEASEPQAARVIESAVTSDTWRDRMLGSNRRVELPLRTTWLAAGQAPLLLADPAERSLPIRLEAQPAAGRHRLAQQQARLSAELRGRRQHLIPAALTLLRAYVAAGRPPQPLPAWSPFDDWSDLVRAALVWVGLPDPCGSRALREAGSKVLRDLVYGLAQLIERRGGPATSSQILAELAAGRPSGLDPRLRTALAQLFPAQPADQPLSPAQLTATLTALSGRLTGGACIARGPHSARGIRWLVRWPTQEANP